MKIVVVIPARGGSKRLPRKNILPLMNIPLINYSIIYAQNELPEVNIYMSSDDHEIQKVSQRAGAIVIDRPFELAGDFISTAAVLVHASKIIQERGEDYDYMVLLQATNPLRPKGMLQEALDIMVRERKESLFTVSRLERKLGRIYNERFMPWNYKIGQRSQDIEPLYYENGLLYITSKELIDKGIIFNSESYPMIVHHKYATVDIDSLEDFEYAEYILRQYE